MKSSLAAAAASASLMGFRSPFLTTFDRRRRRRRLLLLLLRRPLLLLGVLLVHRVLVRRGCQNGRCGHSELYRRLPRRYELSAIDISFPVRERSPIRQLRSTSPCSRPSISRSTSPCSRPSISRFRLHGKCSCRPSSSLSRCSRNVE